MRDETVSPSDVRVREYTSLSSLDSGWLKLRDHFIATVGPASGRGKPLGDLLVLADASISGQSSFPMHDHKDMEILTWVISGELSHKDNIGSSASVPQQTMQLMSARDGIYHAEGNTRRSPVRLLQIWIRPNQLGGKPILGTTSITRPGFNLLAAPSEAPLTIRQNAWAYAAALNKEELKIEVPQGRHAYAVSIGELRWGDRAVSDGDGLLISPGELSVSGTGQAVLIIQMNDI